YPVRPPVVGRRGDRRHRPGSAAAEGRRHAPDHDPHRRAAPAAPARGLCRGGRGRPGRVARGPWETGLAMGTVQAIPIAKRTGFCYGVREAIDMAKEASAKGKTTHTLGQVVHNEGVVRDLLALGIETVETLDDVDRGAAVVIRAHGVKPEVMARAQARGLEVIDGTCTWVIQEQKELRKLV